MDNHESQQRDRRLRRQVGRPLSQTAEHSRANSPNKDEAKPSVKDVWGVPMQGEGWKVGNEIGVT